MEFSDLGTTREGEDAFFGVFHSLELARGSSQDQLCPQVHIPVSAHAFHQLIKALLSLFEFLAPSGGSL